MTRYLIAGFLLTAALSAVASAGPPPAATGGGDADAVNVELTIQYHKFDPAEIRVPSGKPIIITIKNLDKTPEEFDSTALKAELIVEGHSQDTLRLRPLGPGRFPFKGERYPDTAQGVVIAQ